MTAPVRDRFSITGRTLPVAERTQLLVIGAGPAGLAAACEAALLGIRVVLVDENPVPPETMGDDIPLLFGQRMSGAVRNAGAMTEAFVASEPRLEQAFEAGVDIRLGTIVWGLYANNAATGWLPGPVAGLSTGGAAGMLGFDHAIVAAGHRDMGLAFPGWDLPGVMGAAAALRLSRRYGALDARRVVLIGSTAEALTAALTLHRAGVVVLAVVEQAEAPVGPADLLAALAAAGIALLCGHVVKGAEGADQVASVTLAGPAGETAIACDTVILGIGAVPVIELLDAVGCGIGFDAHRGGFVPRLDAEQATTLPFLRAAGDCAGTWPAKSMDRGIAEAEGRRAAIAVARALSLPIAAVGGAVVGAVGGAADEPAGGAAPDSGAFDAGAYRLDWVRRVVLDGGGATPVCRCEEVTARDILEVRPPRYLGWTRPPVIPGANARSLTSLLGDGPPNQDQVKRLTRAGMGVCQGRRCREQVAALLALGAGIGLGDVPPASHRAPVRPLPLALAGGVAMGADMAEGWDTWFGMRSQMTPYWEVAADE